MSDTRFIRRPALVLAALTLLFTASLPARAGMVTSDEVLGQAQSEVQRETLNRALQRDGVRQGLREMGVAPRDAERRVARLSDRELARLHQRLDTLPAGGDLSRVQVLLIILLIVLIA